MTAIHNNAWRDYASSQFIVVFSNRLSDRTSHFSNGWAMNSAVGLSLLRGELRFGRPMIKNLKSLKSIRCAGGEVHRRLISIAGTPVVVLQKTHPILRPSFTGDSWQRFATATEIPQEVVEILESWNRGLRFSYNCHLLAIGSVVGLTTSDWLEGSAGKHTLLQNPAQDVLKKFFDLVCTGNSSDELEFQHDDVLVMRCPKSGDIVHSGQVWKKNDRTLIISKVGEHPAAATSLESLQQLYRSDDLILEIHRKRADLLAESTTSTSKHAFSTRHSQRVDRAARHGRKLSADSTK